MTKKEVFTDDDLKRLKEHLVYRKEIQHTGQFDKHIYRLIARLEAAERFIWDHKDPKRNDALLTEWRKSAGK